MRMEPIAAAEQLILRDYPNCLLAVLGGSASRGEHNEHSDLDIVIIDESVEDLSRKTLSAYGWVVELFFLTLSEYRDQFDAGVMSWNPTLQRIVSEGKVIRSSPVGEKIRQEAQCDLAYGPLPLTSYDIDVSRYMITEYMMDLKGTVKGVESWFVAQKLSTLLCEFILRVNTQWIGEGKTLYRLLSTFDAKLADNLEEALELFYRHQNRDGLINLASQLIEPFGGPYLIGYEE